MKKTLSIITLFVLSNCSDKNGADQKVIRVATETNITKTIVADSICTINEIVSDKHEHFNDLFKSINKGDYNFSKIITTFRHHVTDTITKLKSRDIIIVNLGKDFGIEMHVKGLKKIKQITFDDLKIDAIQMIQYYHGPHIIKDDIIDDTTKRN